MTRFFILSLPRQRTAWLANFLTYGRTICFHEAVHRYSSTKELADDWAPRESVGTVDGSAALLYPQLRKLMPEAKWVCVLSDPQETIHSLERIVPELDTRSIWALYEAILTVAEQPGNIVVPSHQIFTLLGLSELSGWLGLDRPDPERFAMLERMNIQVDAKTILAQGLTSEQRQIYDEVDLLESP